MLLVVVQLPVTATGWNDIEDPASDQNLAVREQRRRVGLSRRRHAPLACNWVVQLGAGESVS